MILLTYLLILFLANLSLAAAQSEPPVGTSTTALEAAALPSSFAAVVKSHDYVNTLQIQQTLGLYAFIVDGKQWDQLDMVFYDDVWANYSALIGVFHPLSALKAGLRTSVAQVTTQHALTTMLIDISEDGTTARSATQFTASHWGTRDFYGEALWGWGTYEDNWIKDSVTSRWKIIQRTIIYPGPLFGNVSIFGDITGLGDQNSENFSVSLSSPDLMSPETLDALNESISSAEP